MGEGGDAVGKTRTTDDTARVICTFDRHNPQCTLLVKSLHLCLRLLISLPTFLHMQTLLLIRCLSVFLHF